MKWEEKLNLLSCIASDLEAIHSQGLEHRDLHSGNILQDDLSNAYITDLGFSNTKKEVHGVLPYVAPEVLQGNPLSQAADIYSFGIIMTEITTGQRTFDDCEFNAGLAMRICNGLRPELAPGVPECYIELVKRCTHSDLKERPTAKSINALITYWIEELVSESNLSIIKRRFLKADKIINEIPTVKQKHPDHMYTSKLINTREIKSKIVVSNPINSVEIVEDV